MISIKLPRLLLLILVVWAPLRAQEPEEIIESLRNTISVLQDQINALNGQVEATTASLTATQATLATTTANLTAAEAALATANATLATTEAALATAMADVATARAQGRADVTGDPATYNLFTTAQYNAARALGQTDVTADPATYNLYTAAGLRALHVGTPLLLRDATTGKFRLKLALQSSSNLIDFAAKPFVANAIAINSAGELEFDFDVPESTAFFRVSAR